MEWLVRLDCRDKNRILHERAVARLELQTDVLRPEEAGLSLVIALAAAARASAARSVPRGRRHSVPGLCAYRLMARGKTGREARG